MTPGDRIAVTETQQAVSPPHARLGRLAYAWIVNANATPVYVSVWSGTSLSRTAAQRAGGPWLVLAGQAVPVLLEVHAPGGVVLAAHTAANLTGAPAAAIDVVPMWQH